MFKRKYGDPLQPSNPNGSQPKNKVHKITWNTFVLLLIVTAFCSTRDVIIFYREQGFFDNENSLFHVLMPPWRAIWTMK